jgi:hypothetical protein
MEQVLIEETEEQEDQEAEQDTRKRRALMALADICIKTRDEAVSYRRSTGIERQWEEDEATLRDGTAVGHGGDKVTDYAQGIGNKQLAQRNTRSSVVVNIVRGRTEVAEARFADIQLPTDAKNWGIDITPNPELDDQRKDQRPALQNGQPITDDQGQQAPMSAVAMDKIERARKAMKLMETEIDDQLSECDYNAEQRKLIKQAARLGAGIIKGPNIVKSVQRKWVPEEQEDGSIVHVMQSVEKQTPSSRFVDIWKVYFSPGTTSNIQKSCEYVWEQDTILPRDIINLIGVKGYFDDQLKSILLEKPKRTSWASTGRDGEKTTELEMGNAYELWEGVLDIPIEYLEAIGCNCKDDYRAISAAVVMINDRPVKVELNTLDTGGIPYDVFRWADIDINSPYGIGIPRMLSWLHRILKAAWRAMMDNSGDSARTTIVASKSLQPAQGQLWQLGSTFINKDDMEDARKAFAVFSVPNNQQHYQAIIELVLRFADLETALPTIFQGEAQKQPDTLGQTNIAVDSSNVGLRHRTKHYDDDITDKHITRYYNYNMQYSDKPEIKGDFKVISRGTSVLLERDQQGRAIMEVYALKQDPHFDRIIDWDKAAEMAVKSRRLDILKSEDALTQYDEQRKQQEQPEPPEMQLAKLKADGELKKEDMRQQADMAELKFKAEQAALDRAHDAEMKAIDFQMKSMEYAEKAGMSLDKLKVQLALSAQGGKAPQVATPPTEPSGRAQTGRAYQE